jgi:hypothetical protein
MKRRGYVIGFVIGVIILGGVFFREEIAADIKDLFHIRPTQYYGVTVDMSQILPDSDRYVVNSQGEDLIDIASKLGINTFRLTNIASINNNKATSSYSHKQWEQILNKMRKKGIYAVILIEGNAQDAKFHELKLSDYYTGFVEEYIVHNKACGFSNVLAVDIRNEPLIDEQNVIRLRQASNMVKKACPQAKITIGSWRTDSGKKNERGEIEYNWHDPKVVKQLNDMVDIHSVHIYGFDKENNGLYPDPYTLTSKYLKEIRKYTSKPILIEEFGAGNGTVITDQKTIGNKELQKRAYAGVLRAVKDMQEDNVIGAIAYLWLSRSDQPDGWSIAEDNANTLFPAAYTFKEVK